jgi:hypothetical protein
MNSPESPPWGFLQWAVAGLASIGASATAFVWRLMTRIHTLEIVVGQHQRDLDVSQSANESALLRLAERLALLHDDHYRLRETIGLSTRIIPNDALVAMDRHLSREANGPPPNRGAPPISVKTLAPTSPETGQQRLKYTICVASFHTRVCSTENSSAWHKSKFFAA